MSILPWFLLSAKTLLLNQRFPKYGFHIDLNLFHEEQYEIKVFQRWFLGSLGKKLTLSRVEPEDWGVYNKLCK